MKPFIVFQKPHRSFWYSKDLEYNLFLKEDIFIRDFFLNNFPKDSFSDLKIERKLNFLTITIFLVNNSPNFSVDEELLYSLQSKLSNLFSTKFTSKVITLRVSVLEKVNSNATVLCKFISQQLQKRVPFRRVIRSAVLKAQSSDIKGIKVQISGRLNGAEIARTEWVREGKIPLHTLLADLDYCAFNARVFFLTCNFLINFFYFSINFFFILNFNFLLNWSNFLWYIGYKGLDL